MLGFILLVSDDLVWRVGLIWVLVWFWWWFCFDTFWAGLRGLVLGLSDFLGVLV